MGRGGYAHLTPDPLGASPPDPRIGARSPYVLVYVKLYLRIVS